jgi:hypothetical protein
VAVLGQVLHERGKGPAVEVLQRRPHVRHARGVRRQPGYQADKLLDGEFGSWETPAAVRV